MSFDFEEKKLKTLNLSSGNFCLLTKKWSYEITLGQFSSTVFLVFILQFCIKVQYLFSKISLKQNAKKTIFFCESIYFIVYILNMVCLKTKQKSLNFILEYTYYRTMLQNMLELLSLQRHSNKIPSSNLMFTAKRAYCKQTR